MVKLEGKAQALTLPGGPDDGASPRTKGAWQPEEACPGVRSLEEQVRPPVALPAGAVRPKADMR